MSNYAISLKRTTLLLVTLAFTAALLVANLSIFSIGQAGAAQFSVRSVNLSSTLDGTNTGTANSELGGSDSTHTFAFDNATAGTVLSMRFEYCQAAIGACTAPTNIEVETGTTITTQTHEGTTLATVFTVNGASSTANRLDITRASGAAFGAGTAGNLVFAFDDIRNPDTEATFFVRMTSYSDAAWTTAVDTGTVASSITTGIAITSKVVETLGFSTTATVGGVGAEGTTCAAVTGSGAIALGDATEGTLSISQAYDAFSAFRLYTNAAGGVVVQYRGSTLTKGADSIDAIGGVLAASDVGVEQFGLAIDPNGGIFTGDTGGFGAAGQLALAANYSDGDGTIIDGGTASFAYVASTLTTIATASSYVDCDTAAVRYIGNISPLTPAGTYTTTVVYYAVPTY
ncbi:MAG: hypothetical protein M3Q36_03770 [bacterium]|nr:hypothetical protein [bacterium]